MGLGGVPGLTLQPALGGVLPALVKPAITLHTRGCKRDNNNVFKMTSFYSNLLVARSYLMSVMPDLVQVELALVAAILGSVSHSGSRK